MARGGKKGNKGGRKEGSQNLPKLSSFFTVQERDAFVTHLKRRALKSDKIAIFVGERLFEPKPTPIDANLSGNITITFDNAFKK